MAKVGIFYGSTGGNTEEVAEQIQELLGDLADEPFDIGDVDADEVTAYGSLIFGVPTYDEGELQEDWADFVDENEDIDFSGKKIALFGLGDQEGYPEFFVSALGKLYKFVTEKGATVVGHTETDGFDYEESEAEIDGKFVGLALDEDNQDDQTEARLNAWIASIKPELS